MTAQVDDLMRDKNITWIAESYNDFLTDESAAETIGKRISGARLLKFYNPTEGGMPEEFVLQDFILELAKAGQLLKQEIFFQISTFLSPNRRLTQQLNAWKVKTTFFIQETG